MCLKLRCILGMVLGLLGLLTPLVFAAEQASKPFPTAQLVAVEGEAHRYRVIDRGGRVIMTTVPRSRFPTSGPTALTASCMPPSSRSTWRPTR